VGGGGEGCRGGDEGGEEGNDMRNRPSDHRTAAAESRGLCGQPGEQWGGVVKCGEVRNREILANVRGAKVCCGLCVFVSSCVWRRVL